MPMNKTIALAASLLVLGTASLARAVESGDAAPPSPPRASGPVETVKEAAVEVGHAVKETAIEVGHAARETAVQVGLGVKNAAVEAGHVAMNAAQKVGEGVKSAVSSGPSQPPPPKQD